MTTRRQRLVAGAAVAAAVVALAAVLVTRASNDHADHTEHAVRATAGPTTSTASASTSTAAPTAAPTATSALSTSEAAMPASALTALRLPGAGVVVELADANDADRGVALVDLDGRVIARLPDGTIHTSEDTAGPLILRTGSGDYLLDPTSRRLIEQPFHDTFEIRLPLAYGATLVSRMRADPGSYAIEDGGEVVAELGNRMDAGFVVANDRDLVTVLDDDPPTVIDVRTHRRSRLPARCEAADRHGARWLLLCPSTEPSLRDTVKVQEGTHLTTLFGPADDRGGHWRSASFANDGEDVLLQWSGECETRSVYLGEATNGGSGPSGPSGPSAPGGPPRQLPSTGVEAFALGWSPANQAVIVVPSEPGCGSDGDLDGIHLVTASGHDRTIFRPDGDLRIVSAALWRSLP